MPVIKEELFSEIISEIVVDKFLDVVFLVQKVMKVHFIEIRSNIVADMFCHLLIFLDSGLVIAKFDANLVSFSL